MTDEKLIQIERWEPSEEDGPRIKKAAVLVKELVSHIREQEARIQALETRVVALQALPDMQRRRHEGTLPELAGAANGSATSAAAAKSLEHKIGELQAKVYEFIKSKGARGATDEEVEFELGMLRRSSTARRRELVLGGLVMDSRATRVGSTQRQLTVWIATQFNQLH